MIEIRILAVSAVFLLGLGGAVAQESKDHARKSQQTEAQVEREAEEMLSAVVRVRMKALPDARSNTTLGPSREGTGVVIDERGHIVTIGYIVIEADSIEITTQDDRTVSATLIGYDHASGFGLLRSGSPLGVKPMPMGQAAEELHGHLLVTRVSAEGPADKAGVRNGDIVVGVAADPVKTQEELYRRVWGLGAAGIEVPLRILQGADMREFRLRSIDRFQYFKEKPVY